MSGGSLLPAASRLHPNDSSGGGIILSRIHHDDSSGGGIILGKRSSKIHHDDSSGGGIILKGYGG